MTVKIKQWLWLAPFCCFLYFPSFETHSVEVIVNSSVPQKQLSASHLRRIFTVRHRQWANDLPIKVFVLAKNNATHKNFCLQKLEVFPYQLEKIWGKLLFSGLGEPPLVLTDEKEMIEMVRKTPGAIGYVDSLPQNSGVEIMKMESSDD
ncbi:hypothetical protein [Thalassomonas viridans]|uniref:hypothetical protein n=1 Tax=Thalassomonas viridans TaxID=137584 RepID=UPI001F3E68F4|nr:hypothetical protein [Thalassomonas viridans]